MNGKKEAIIGVCWYQPDEWEMLKQTATDSETLDDSYEDWKKNANRAINGLRSNNTKVKKVNVKINELIVWCGENKLENNSKTRSRYAAWKLLKS